MHAQRAPSQVPRAVRAREGDQSRQPVTSVIWQVSTNITSIFFAVTLLMCRLDYWTRIESIISKRKDTIVYECTKK